MMDYAGVTSGVDLVARRYTQYADELAETLRLSGASLYEDILTSPGVQSPEQRWAAHVMWGYFTCSW